MRPDFLSAVSLHGGGQKEPIIETGKRKGATRVTPFL